VTPPPGHGVGTGLRPFAHPARHAPSHCARGEVELIQLVVERKNLTARRLYTSLGFVEYGLEVNARKFGDRYFDDVLMAKDLTKTG
jgi:ribosomal protein S18 acetylase RimI-like enzyme